MHSSRQETFCARFVRQFDLPGDPEANPCMVCGWPKREHVTVEDLELAVTRREARLIVDRPGFRLFFYRGFRYSCVLISVEIWSRAARNRTPDYRGTRSYWQIKTRAPERPLYRRGSTDKAA